MQLNPRRTSSIEKRSILCVSVLCEMIVTDFTFGMFGIFTSVFGFADTSPGRVTCLQATFDFMPIATLRQYISGKEQSSYGSVIFSLKANTEIRSLEDLEWKRVGVGQPFGSGSYQLSWEVQRLIFGLIAGRQCKLRGLHLTQRRP